LLKFTNTCRSGLYTLPEISVRHGREPERCPAGGWSFGNPACRLGHDYRSKRRKKGSGLDQCDCIGECRSSRAVHRSSGDARFGSL